MEILFLALQGFIVAFLLLHDWVPLGRLNNYVAMKDEDSLGHRVFATALGAVPAGYGLWECVRFYGRVYPHGLTMFLWIMYAVFVAGMLRAWWVPYLLVPDEARAARYRVIFAKTHRFLPERNGMAPDTLHTTLHVATVAVMVMLWCRGFWVR